MDRNYEKLNNKIYNAISQDQESAAIMEKLGSYDAEFAPLEQLMPSYRARFDSAEEFVNDVCSEQTAHYFDENVYNDIREAKTASKRRMLEDELEEYHEAIIRNSEIARKASNALARKERVQKALKERFRYLTREAIRENYYSPEVQAIFKAVENKAVPEIDEDDDLSPIVNEEAKKFIAAREYFPAEFIRQPKK